MCEWFEVIVVLGGLEANVACLFVKSFELPEICLSQQLL